MREHVASNRVGFDRFISGEWANQALSISLLDISLDEKDAKLKEYLLSRIGGVEAARKARNVLATLWLRSVNNDFLIGNIPEIVNSRIDSTDNIFLHHGRALVVFPFYRNASRLIGKLGALQQSFTSADLRKRIAETYGDLSSLERSIDRILQTQVNWGLLIKTGKEFRIKGNEIYLPNGHSWLITCALLSIPENRCPISELTRLPELLGYSISLQIIHQTPWIKIERDGSNREIAYLVT